MLWYWDKPLAIDNSCIGRWLCVSHQVRSELCYWILTDKGTVLYRMKFQHVKIDETRDPKGLEKVKDYIDILYGNLSDMKYIYTESDFSGFIIGDYLPQQGYELTNNKWEY